MSNIYPSKTLENGAWLLLNQLFINTPTSTSASIPEINVRAIFSYFSAYSVSSQIDVAQDQRMYQLLNDNFMGGSIQLNEVYTILSGEIAFKDEVLFNSFASTLSLYLNPPSGSNGGPNCNWSNSCGSTISNECALWCLYRSVYPAESFNQLCLKNNCNSSTSGSAGSYIIAILNSLNAITLKMAVSDALIIVQAVSTSIQNFLNLTNYTDGYLVALITYFQASLIFTHSSNSLKDMEPQLLLEYLVNPSKDKTEVASVTSGFQSLYQILWQIYCEMFQDSTVTASSLVNVTPCSSTYECTSPPCSGISNCTLTEGMSQYFGLCVSPVTTCPNDGVPCACTFPSVGAMPVDGTPGCCPSGTTCATGWNDPTYGADCACCGVGINVNDPVSCGGVCFPSNACGLDQDIHTCCADSESWSGGCQNGTMAC